MFFRVSFPKFVSFLSFLTLCIHLLVALQDPPVRTVRKFLHLLENDHIDFSEELGMSCLVLYVIIRLTCHNVRIPIILSLIVSNFFAISLSFSCYFACQFIVHCEPCYHVFIPNDIHWLEPLYKMMKL